MLCSFCNEPFQARLLGPHQDCKKCGNSLSYNVQFAEHWKRRMRPMTDEELDEGAAWFRLMATASYLKAKNWKESR